LKKRPPPSLAAANVAEKTAYNRIVSARPLRGGADTTGTLCAICKHFDINDRKEYLTFLLFYIKVTYMEEME